jgi:membrane associated rhomboid family serine protease
MCWQAGWAPGGIAADIWTFVTYGFLHGGVTHIAFNMLWMVIFGSAVARRFGAVRFLVFSALCAAGGAAMHLATHFGAEAPMIGASAAVSGHMAAAVRFVFELGGPLGMIRRSDEAAYKVPAAPLLRSFANRQVVAFLFVWFGLNLVFGLYSTPFDRCRGLYSLGGACRRLPGRAGPVSPHRSRAASAILTITCCDTLPRPNNLS